MGLLGYNKDFGFTLIRIGSIKECNRQYHDYTSTLKHHSGMVKKRNQKKPELEILKPQLGGCCDNSSETWRQPGLAWGCSSRNGINGVL